MKWFLKALLVILIVVWALVGIITVVSGIGGPEIVGTMEVVVRSGDTISGYAAEYYPGMDYRIYLSDVRYLNGSNVIKVLDIGETIILPVY